MLQHFLIYFTCSFSIEDFLCTIISYHIFFFLVAVQFPTSWTIVRHEKVRRLHIALILVAFFTYATDIFVNDLTWWTNGIRHRHLRRCPLTCGVFVLYIENVKMFQFWVFVRLVHLFSWAVQRILSLTFYLVFVIRKPAFNAISNEGSVTFEQVVSRRLKCW